jgi:pectate lyase
MTSSGKKWGRLSGVLVAVTALLVVSTGVGTASAATLISDNFEDGNAAGWTTTGGTWIVNSLTDSSRVLRQSSLVAGALARTGSLSWQDYTVTAAVKPENFNGLPGWAGVVARASSTSNYYALVLKANDTVALTRTIGGTTQTLSSTKFSVDTGTWYTLSLNVDGSRLTGTVGGTSLSVSDGYLYGGPGGLTTTWTVAAFDNVVISD